MSLMIPEQNLCQLDYETAEKTKKESVWQSLEKITVAQAVELFLKSFKTNTAETYGRSFERIFYFRLLDPKMNLKQFAMMNLDSKLDNIKQAIPGSEGNKQGKAAVFVSFTGFLQRKTEGLIRKAIPNKEKGRKTFQKIREKTVCRPLNPDEIERFLGALRQVSLRNYLLGAMQLQGAKRISEVLDSRIEAVDWNQGWITFKQKKSDVLEKETVVFFPQRFMQDLKSYLGERAVGYVFITSSGKQMTREDVRQIYGSAYKKTGIVYRSLTHTLRATTITSLSKQGYRAEEIAKLSGHSDVKMVSYYDQSELENNPSRNANII